MKKPTLDELDKMRSLCYTVTALGQGASLEALNNFWEYFYKLTADTE